MDQELREYLGGMEIRLTEVVDKKFSVIDKKVDALGEKVVVVTTRVNALDMKLDGVTTRVDAVDKKVDAVATRVDEVDNRIEAVETNLLTQFWQWARTAEIRYRQVAERITGISVDDAAVQDRLTAVEDRVAALERSRSQ